MPTSQAARVRRLVRRALDGLLGGTVPCGRFALEVPVQDGAVQQPKETWVGAGWGDVPAATVGLPLLPDDIDVPAAVLADYERARAVTIQALEVAQRPGYYGTVWLEIEGRQGRLTVCRALAPLTSPDPAD